MKTKVSLEEAQSILQSCVKPKTAETVSLLSAHQRILAVDIYAPMNQPPFDRSPVDGYAVRANDTIGASKVNSKKLKITEEVCAGNFPENEITENTACRIMTGAPIPKGADCVVRQEDTSEDGGYVEIHTQLQAGENYCRQGEDIKKGEHILKKGAVLSYAGVGILASMGISEVPVYQIPKVAILSIGDELTSIGRKLHSGKIYDSNLYTIGLRLQEYGMELILLGSAADDPEVCREKIKEGLSAADLLITTGGVSVGKKDLVKEIVEEMGADILFWKINMKPGTPVLVCTLGGKPVIGLSGNPAAACISLELLVRPFFAYYANRQDLKLRKTEAVLENSYLKESHRRRFLRGKIAKKENVEFVALADKHSPGVLSSLYRCDCFIDVPEGTSSLYQGQKVGVFKL